jgi:hypothetical protein
MSDNDEDMATADNDEDVAAATADTGSTVAPPVDEPAPSSPVEPASPPPAPEEPAPPVPVEPAPAAPQRTNTLFDSLWDEIKPDYTKMGDFIEIVPGKSRYTEEGAGMLNLFEFSLTPGVHMNSVRHRVCI